MMAPFLSRTESTQQTSRVGHTRGVHFGGVGAVEVNVTNQPPPPTPMLGIRIPLRKVLYQEAMRST